MHPATELYPGLGVALYHGVPPVAPPGGCMQTFPPWPCRDKRQMQESHICFVIYHSDVLWFATQMSCSCSFDVPFILFLPPLGEGETLAFLGRLITFFKNRGGISTEKGQMAKFYLMPQFENRQMLTWCLYRMPQEENRSMPTWCLYRMPQNYHTS